MCSNGFGSEKFQRSFVSLQTLRQLVGRQALQVTSGWDIRQLMGALCCAREQDKVANASYFTRASLLIAVSRLLQRLQKLERLNALRVDDLTSIVRSVSAAPFFKHLLQMDYWSASLLKRVERLGLGNIEDIETTFRNLEFRDSQLLALLRRRKETLLN